MNVGPGHLKNINLLYWKNIKHGLKPLINYSITLQNTKEIYIYQTVYMAYFELNKVFILYEQTIWYKIVNLIY